MLDQIKMNVVKTAENGIVNHETLFHFTQEADTVRAHYRGGRISDGYLVGTIKNKVLSFVYCQKRVSGEMDHGQSKCMISTDKETGKLKLEEKFSMTSSDSKELGTNIFMEI